MSKKYKTGEQLIEEGYLPIDLLNNTFSGLWPAYDISSTSTEPITPNPVLSKLTALIQALKNERDMKLRVDAERRGKLLELTKRKRDKKSSNEIFALEETIKGSASYLRTEDYEKAINLLEGIVADPSKHTWKNIQSFYSQGYNDLLSFLDRRTREQAFFDSILEDLKERRYPEPCSIQQSERGIQGSIGVSDKSIFSCADITSWSQVTLVIVNDYMVEITANGQTHNKEYSEIGLSGRGKGPSLKWELLRTLAQHNGILQLIDPKPEKRDDLKKRVSQLRKDLKRIFNINDDPFEPWAKVKGYKTKFTLYQKG